MQISTMFTLVMCLILLRIFWVKVKAASAHSENFKKLAPKDQLGVLKECLLNNPTLGNLQNLKEFCEKHSLYIDTEIYKPFLKLQLELSKKKNALAEDNELFNKEAAFLDQIKPLEFAEAKKAKESNDNEKFLLSTLEGIARLYSDDAILNELKALADIYPKSVELYSSYQNLMELRDNSLADDESLAKLRKAKTAWENALLQVEL